MAELEPDQNVPEQFVEPSPSTDWNTLPPNRPRKVSSSMWGPLEIAAVAIGAIAVVAAILAYFLFVLPSNRQLAASRSEADRLEAEVLSARAKYGEITTTETQVAKIVSSVDDFEVNYLPVISTGQGALYQRLNSLIAAYDLVNTTGPDYSPLETIGQEAEQQTDEEKGRSRFRSLYPGVYVSTTVEGSYQNLRRFIRDIETGREFVIVSSVELAPSDSEKKDANAPQTAGDPSAEAGPVKPNTAVQPNRGLPPGLNMPVAAAQPGQSQRSQGKMRGDVVSLRIEMAAYFRRPNSSPVQNGQ